jgi:hypothetical protein
VTATHTPFPILLAATAAAVLASAAPADAREVCTEWKLGSLLTVHQSNGANIELKGQQQGTELRGTAINAYVPKSGPFTDSDPVVKKATYDGKARGHEVEFTVYWNANSIGVYTGKINERGRIEGNTHDRMHPESTATWYADELASCAKQENAEPRRTQ